MNLRNTASISLCILGIVFGGTATALAQDDVTTRTLKGVAEADGTNVVINQVDTSAFPKVTIFASVLRDGNPVLGLKESDFRVREDEVDQEPLTVVPKLTPLSVAVTFDTSGSMKKALPTAKTAALSFIDTLADEDEVLAIGFARQVNILAPLGRNKAAARSAIDSTAARGDTALYDALYASVEALKEVKGRKAIILLSDGVDDDGFGRQLSQRTVSQVVELARTVNVPIFTIGLGNSLDEATLSTVAKESGAAYYHAPNAEALKALYDNIGKQLAGQYNIYYTSNLPGDGSAHRVQLSFSEVTSVKEYISPALSAPIAAPATTPSPADPTMAKKVSLFAFGKLNAPNLKTEQITVTARATGKWAGTLKPTSPTLELPAGEYMLKMASYETGPIALGGGESKEIKVGRIVATSLFAGDEIGVRSETGDHLAGNLNFKKNDGVLEVLPGTYRLKSGICYSAPITVVEDQSTTVQISRIEVTNALDDVSVTMSPKDDWCGTLKRSGNSLPLFPGEFRLKVHSCLSMPFALSNGSTQRMTLGFVSMKDLSHDAMVQQAGTNNWCGTLNKNNTTRQVFPGSYRLKVKQHLSEPFTVGEGETVEAN